MNMSKLKSATITPPPPPPPSRGAVAVLTPPSSASTSTYASERTMARKLKRERVHLSLLGSDIGPNFPNSLFHTLLKDSVTHLNLHANSLHCLHLNTNEHCNADAFNSSPNNPDLLSLQDLDVSSNYLGEESNEYKKYKNDFRSQHLPATLLIKSPNLQKLNLSANNLKMESLSLLLNQVSLINLKELNLSHNFLSELPQTTLQEFCPNLIELNLINNVIRKLPELLRSLYPLRNKLSTLHLQDKGGKDKNPVCLSDPGYKSKIICVFPNLQELDGVPTTQKEREEAQFNLGMELMETNPHHQGMGKKESNNNAVSQNNEANGRKKRVGSRGCRDQNGTARLGQFANKKTIKQVEKEGISKESRGRLRGVKTIPGQREQVDRGDGNRNEMDKRMHRATESISLHKLNTLESRVRILSELAEEQADATQQLLSMNQMKNLTENNPQITMNDRASRDTLVGDTNQIITVSEAQIQTSFVEERSRDADIENNANESPIPSPPGDFKKHHSAMTTIEQYTPILFALQKWRILTYRKRISESEKKIGLIWRKRLQVAVERTVAVEEKKHQDIIKNQKRELRTSQDMIGKLEDEIMQLTGELNELKDAQKGQTDHTSQKLEEEFERAIENYEKIERRRNQDERDRVEKNMQKLKDEVYSAGQKEQLAREDLARARQELTEEREKNKQLMSELSERESIAKESAMKMVEQKYQSTNQMKMKKVKDAFEAAAKRSAFDKIKCDRAESVAREAAQIVNLQKRELETLRVQLQNKEMEISRIGAACSTTEDKKKILEKKVRDLLLRQDRLAQEEKQIHRLLEKAKEDTNKFQTELDNKEIKLKKAQKKKTIFENQYREVNCKLSIMEEKFEELENDRKERDDLLNQLEKMKNDVNKDGVRNLQKVEDLEREVQKLNLTINEQDRSIRYFKDEASSLKVSYEKKECKLMRNHERETSFLQEEHRKGLQFIDNQLKRIKREKDKLDRKRERAEQHAHTLAQELSAEKQNKIALEQKVKEQQKALDSQSIRTQQAVQGLCKQLMSPQHTESGHH